MSPSTARPAPRPAPLSTQPFALPFLHQFPGELKPCPSVDGAGRRRRQDMKRIATLAAVLLIGTAASAYAQRSPGASENTPADSMKDNSSTLSGTKSPG